jgi:hypothetical protein
VRFPLALLVLFPVLSVGRFSEHVIANDLKGGYQVVAADLNGDGKMDVIALASGQPDLVWYENPTWQRHAIAANMHAMINLAYWDGQIALASNFSMEAKKSIGSVAILTPNGDPRALWNSKIIDHLTTSHRLRWADIYGNGHKVLINAPLTGVHAEPPEYRDHVPLVFYRPGEWKQEVISHANEGIQHGLFITDWGGGGRDAILTGSFSGIDLFQLEADGNWTRTEIARGDPDPCPKCGTSDIAVGRLGHEKFLATIEPWHGNELAVYRRERGQWKRTVIYNSLVQGHTIVAADLDGDGRDEIIAGYRGNGGSVLIYKADPRGSWSKTILDSKIPANACAVADLNGDARPDLVCIGGSLLKWYENTKEWLH